jgi:membrane associated rhomboid family serine protease
MNVWNEIVESFKKGSNLNKLIYINIAVFIVVKLIKVFFALMASNGYDVFAQYLMVPSSFSNFFRQPWSIISYMFLHEGFFHIVFNLLWFYWFGSLFYRFFNDKAILGVYFLGGIFGALLYMISYNIFPAFNEVVSASHALGASASVYAVIIAATAFNPNYKIRLIFIGPVKILWIALFALVSDLINIADGQNVGGHIAHLGGAIFGLIYAMQIKNGKDMLRGFNHFMDSIFSILKRKPKQRMKVTHKKAETDWDYNKRKASEKAELDRILEKIKKGGYDSLSKKEKETLFNMSNK